VNRDFGPSVSENAYTRNKIVTGLQIKYEKNIYQNPEGLYANYKE
jgi:hypothetical protein